MSKHDGSVTPTHMIDASVDGDELAKFAPLAEQWWDASGPMRPLHKLNPLRLDYILTQVCRHFGCQKAGHLPLEGLTVLDVGCGGGLLCEPLSRLGAVVTGIDPEVANVDTASWHAGLSGLDVRYEAVTVEDMLLRHRTFDVVTALEVIEHVPDQAAFVASLVRAVRPGGILVLSTLSRTLSAFLQAIVGAEYVLGWLPRGTHRWRRFIQPSSLARLLRDQGMHVLDVKGVAYDPAHDRFTLRRDPSVNYMLTAIRER